MDNLDTAVAKATAGGQAPGEPLLATAGEAPGRVAWSRRWYGGLAIGIYLVVIGGLLAWTHLLPYGSDNNESFSAFIHARNLLQFGFSQSMGLTDEAYSHDPSAHPYVYTHEGNLPRVFVYLLMHLGLTRVEWQMALLAVLVGSATIYFCFTFFSRAAGDVFAFLVCAVLATDYLSFLQWEVNSFRVWHGFFFFACLLCVQALGGRHPRRVGAIWFLTCVALFYFEVVFAVFTVATSVSYALLIYWQRRDLVYRLGLIAGVGAAVAIGGLIAQSVADLGWAVAGRDLQLTILNRNFFVQSGVEGAAHRTLQFFLQHHIVYWRDNPDTRGYLRITSFLRTFGKFGLLVVTPYLVSLMAIVTVAWLLRPLAGARGVLELDSGIPRRGSLRRGGLAVFFLCITAGYELAHLRLYGTDFAPLWRGAVEGYFHLKLILPGLLAAVIIGLLLILEQGQPLAALHGDRSVREGLRYLAAAIGGYVFVYIVSPGYLSQGYLVRYVPLAVFMVDIWIALFFYMLIAIVRVGVSVPGGAARDPVQGTRSKGRLILPRLHVMQVLSIFLLMFATVYWARVQTVYMTTVPLNDYTFMPQLAQPPYRGATFISDVYAAPIAYFTGTWAYADDLVYENLYVKNGGKVVQLISGDKLWEADRETNPGYLHPQYYLCARTPTLYTAASFVSLRSGERLSQCSSEILVRNAHEDVGPFHNTVVAQDQGPWDMWAIVKLDPSIRFALVETGDPAQPTAPDLAQASRLAQGINRYYVAHGCYPRASARSFGAMPEGLAPYIGGGWPHTQMYGTYDRDWRWAGSGATAYFVGVVPHRVLKTAAPRGFVFVLHGHPSKIC